MNTDLRPFFRAGVLALVALLSTGCVTQALVEDGSAGAYVPPSREQTAALQGRAFQLGQVTVAITHPEPPEVHPLPDEAYRRMLAAKLEQAFHAVDERPAGDRQPLVELRQSPDELFGNRRRCFEGGMGDEVEHAGPVLHLDRVQATEEGGQLPLVDEARPVQTPDVRLGAGDVVGQEALVVAERLGELDERLGGRDVEPTVPELAPIGGRAVLGHRCEPGPWTSDQVCTPRPQMRTKPSESAWRNRSAAS